MEEKNTAITNTKSPESQSSINHPNYPFSDVRYICQATTLITDATQKGFDIAQLPNGDIAVTEIKIVNVHHIWNPIKQKFIKLNN